MISVCTTATLRPEILRRTYSSFWYFAFQQAFNEGTHFGLSINIDPVGHDIPIEDVEAVANYYPWRGVSIHEPEAPSFPMAFLRVMREATGKSPLVFWLEEDWQLLAPVDVKKIVSWFDEDPALAIIRLPAFPAAMGGMKNWTHWLPWNGKYFECPPDLRGAIGFCGHPSIIRSEFLRRTLPHLDPAANPEKQYHYVRAILDETYRWKFGVYGIPGAIPFVKDIGREWMQQHGWQKAGEKYFFTQWEKIGG